MKLDRGNPVAKYCKKFNKAVVHRDRKKAGKKGAIKHKGKDLTGEIQ